MQINRKELFNALKLVGKAVPSRSSINVLEGILFQLSEEFLILSGFDINNGIQVKMPIDKQTEKCTFLISAKTIQLVLAKFSSEYIEVDVQSESLIISNGSASAQVQMMPDAQDYPVQCFDLGDAIPQLINQSIIEGMISVLFATSSEASKQILQAVNIATDGNYVAFAATDGHRLAVTSIASDAQIEPISLGNSGLKLLSGFTFTNSEIALYRVNGGVIIAHEGVTFLIREIDGKYPDYQLLLPKDFKINATVDKRDFIDAIELSKTSDDSNKLVKLDFDCNLTVSGEGQIVKSSSIVDCDFVGADSILFAMNSDYLLDALSQVDLEGITLNINAPLSPITIQWQENHFQKTILLMPIQIRS